MPRVERFEPVYNVGPYVRALTLSSEIDRAKIGAQLDDRLLTLTLRRRRTPFHGSAPIG